MRLLNTVSLLGVGAVLFLLSSCDLLGTASTPEVSSRLSMYYIEKVFANPPRQFIFGFTTNERYAKKYRLQYNLTRTDDHIRIQFRGRQKVGDCPDFPMPPREEGCPAEAEVRFNDLTDGDYEFIVETARGRAAGTLTVTPTYASVGMDAPLLRVAPDTVLRIPPNTIFGTVLFDHPSLSAEAQDFFDALKAAGAEPLEVRDGTYHQLGTVEDGAVRCVSEGCEKYLYRYTGPIDDVLDIAQRFRKESENQLEISVYTSDGQEYSFGIRE